MRKGRKLTDLQVVEIRQLVGTGMTRADIARRYAVSPQTISFVLKYEYGKSPERAARTCRTDGDEETWVTVARRYNALFPREEQITPAQAKSIYDQAMRKIRWQIEDAGLTVEDFR